MKEYLPMLRKCKLFVGMEPDELLRMLDCLEGQLIQVSKGGYLLRQGERAECFGVLLVGRAQIIRGDVHGAHAIIASIEPSDIFAEAVACAGVEALPFSVAAIEDCTVLFFQQSRVMKSCTKGCMCHSRFVTALLRMIATKNVFLNQKLDIVMQRTTREKLTSYLQSCSVQANSRQFLLPFDRQGLADYLGVDRSAMSAELSRMKKEGMVDYHKNRFEIYF